MSLLSVVAGKDPVGLQAFLSTLDAKTLPELQAEVTELLTALQDTNINPSLTKVDAMVNGWLDKLRGIVDDAKETLDRLDGLSASAVVQLGGKRGA